LFLLVFSPLLVWLVCAVQKRHTPFIPALLGILSGFVSLAILSVLPSLPIAGPVGLAALEEVVKFLVLFIILYPVVSGQDLKFLPWLGLGAAIAFGTAENAGYVLFSVDGGYLLAFARMFSSLVLHSACGILAGIAVYRLRSASGGFVLPLLGSIVLHSFYNAMVLFGPWGLALALGSAALAVLILGSNFLK